MILVGPPGAGKGDAGKDAGKPGAAPKK